jgi:two-component system, chemotaxis family, response regulator PixG
MLQLSETDVKNSVEPITSMTAAIQQYFHSSQSGVLKISSGTVDGLVYIHRGKPVYLSHSIDPISRLDLYLKELGDRSSALSVDVRNQLRLTLDPTADLQHHLNADLQGISSLLQNHGLSVAEAQPLIATLSREALEVILLLQSSTYTFISADYELNWLQPLNFVELVTTCTDRFWAWQTVRSQIWSPYQRPYLLKPQGLANRLASEGDGRLGKLLKGFSFRHLAVLTYQDELEIARKLYPLILEKIVEVRDPQPPYHALPVIPNFDLGMPTAANLTNGADPARLFESDSWSATKPYRVVCIDNSSVDLQTIKEFLATESLSLFLIQDSVKAIVEVMSINPDLILLDANLTGVGGYEVCRLLRKHPHFRSTPIIMLTSDTGLIEQAQATVAGATDFMMKPFSQSQLLKTVLRYLSKS